MTSHELIDLLLDCDHTPRSYSGRGMYGKECVGVRVDDPVDVLQLGICIGEAAIGVNLPKASFDSLGRGFILYWPRMEWPGDVYMPDVYHGDY